jgi:hypothetical protein
MVPTTALWQYTGAVLRLATDNLFPKIFSVFDMKLEN